MFGSDLVFKVMMVLLLRCRCRLRGERETDALGDWWVFYVS